MEETVDRMLKQPNIFSYVWGDNVHKAKTQCERLVWLTFFEDLVANSTSSLDYIFQLAVEMKKLSLPWTK